MRLSVIAVAIGTLLALTACERGSKVDLAAEEQKIHALVDQWGAAMAAKDAKASAEFYATDGVMMPPGTPAIESREALTAAWQGLFSKPGFQLTIKSTKIVVAQAGDLAYERGVYELAFDGEQGPVKDKGKYVVVWKKVDGNWKAAADIFNSDDPAT
jgi:uncharacterized protein (TIGR02246 family)